jgi:xylono-1,5-lactonase
MELNATHLNQPTCVWNVQAALGEGALGHQGRVWLVDVMPDKIHCFDPASGAQQSWSTPPNPGFIQPKRKGGFLVGLRTGLHDFDPGSGTFLLRERIEPDLPGNRLNDAHVDAAGRLWFGTMDYDGRDASGALYVYEELRLRMVDPGYRITNGPAMSPDGTTLYHADTMERRIYAFDVVVGGVLANKRLFAKIGKGYPDGMAVDSRGQLWNALYGGWGINRYAPDGTLIDHIAFPVANVTKLAFGGDDLKTVYATTARQGLSKAELADQPLAGGLFSFRTDVAGLPQETFDG